MLCVYVLCSEGKSGPRKETQGRRELRSAGLGIHLTFPSLVLSAHDSNILFYFLHSSLFSPLCHSYILLFYRRNIPLDLTLCDEHAIRDTLSALSIVWWRRIPRWSPEPARSNRHGHAILQNEIMRSGVERVERENERSKQKKKAHALALF